MIVTSVYLEVSKERINLSMGGPKITLAIDFLQEWSNLLLFCYCISSDFSDLQDVTDECMDVSVYALTGWFFIRFVFKIYTKVMF